MPKFFRNATMFHLKMGTKLQSPKCRKSQKFLAVKVRIHPVLFGILNFRGGKENTFGLYLRRNHLPSFTVLAFFDAEKRSSEKTHLSPKFRIPTPVFNILKSGCKAKDVMDRKVDSGKAGSNGRKRMIPLWWLPDQRKLAMPPWRNRLQWWQDRNDVHLYLQNAI